jgi:hypothetical protein
MTYGVGMGSGAMIYMQNITRIRSGIQMLVGEEEYTDTPIEWRSHRFTFIFPK